MAGLGGTKEWIQFFTDSGIPSGIAASYALTFFNNRIRMDMLLDLNKEYLKDMGITLMGDVISILRHAKQVHEQNARDKVLGSSTASSTAPTPPLPKSTPASRMLDHYMRKSDHGTGEETDEPSPQLKTAISSTTVKTKKPVMKTKSEVAEPTSAPPAKKVRRVLPEHEGSYKITMPSGSTPRSQKILAKQGLLLQQKKKKTVFDRLGDGSVSSTTEVEGPSITITGPGLNIVKPATSPQEKQSSVFSRLGEKPQVSSTSNTDTEELQDIPVSSLPYAGVFKQQDTRKKVEVKRVKVPTMQADIESAQQLITKDGRVLTKSVQLQERLGAHSPEKKIIKTNKTTAGILGNPTNAKKLSVKARLGSSDSPASSTDLSNRQKKVILIKRTGESEGTITRQVMTPAPVKSVTFGGVTKKTFIPREAITSVTRNKNPVPINKNLNVWRVQRRPISGVFSRLGS